MNSKLFANFLELENIEAKIIDASMGVVGGELKASNIYSEQFQGVFRQHTQHPDWVLLKALNLRAISQVFGELRAEGGICITDVEGFDEIAIEICGLDSQIISELLLVGK